MDTPSNEPDGNPPVLTDRPPAGRFARYAELLVALAFVALGIVVLIETQDIRVAKAYSKVGPRVIPTIVGWGAIVIGAWYAIDVLRGNTAAPSDDAEDADPTLPADWGTLAGLATALVLYALLMKTAGYVVASTIMFWVAAWSMGSRSYLRDALIGLAVSVASYYAFKEGLNIRLPQGIWFW
jgi:putative tricarboxylic transport membrane protein